MILQLNELISKFLCGQMKRIGRHRLSIDIPDEMYKKIKESAVTHNVTVTRCITRALLVYLITENRIDIKETIRESIVEGLPD